MDNSAPTLHYFGVKARGWAISIAAACWEKELHWERYNYEDWKNDKNEIHSKCAFGQLPILVDGDNVVPQSSAILRYLARKWGKTSKDVREFGRDNQLLEASKDLYNIVRSAKYGGGTAAAYKEALKKLKKHYDNLAALMVNGVFSKEITMGDIQLFANLNIIVGVDPKTLDTHPTLKNWYHGIASRPRVQALLQDQTVRPYYTMPEDSFTLYGFYPSQPVRSVMLLANVCKVPHKFHPMSFKDMKADWYLKINSAGQVPAIVHDKFTLAEGAAILAYLAEHYKLEKWYPTDSNVRAQVNKWMHWHHSNARLMTLDGLRPVLMGGDAAAALEFIKGKMQKILATLNDALEGNDSFLASVGHPTIADLLLLPEIDQAFFIPPFKQVMGSFLDPYPNVHRWLESLKNHLGEVYDSQIEKCKSGLLAVAKQLGLSPNSKPTMHYFGFKGRGFPAYIAAAYYGKEFHWEKYSFSEWRENKNDIKSKCAFGQMPVLIDGNTHVPQSQAILRYLGKKWGKDGGSNMKDVAISEMLIEESNDIFDLMVHSAFRNGDTPSVWEEALGKLPKHYDNLEKMMTNGKFGSEILIGDISLFCAIHMITYVDPYTLKDHGVLKAWYDQIAHHSNVKSSLDHPSINWGPKGDDPLVYHYFGVKARGFAIPLAAAYYDLSSSDFRWEKYSFDDWKNNKNDIKSHLAFGQLPALNHGKKWTVQSMAITRVASKKWGLEGDGIKDFGISEMLIEESNDLFEIFNDAKYRMGDTPDAWETQLAKFSEHLPKLEKLLTNGNFASERVMGDFCLFAVFNIALDNDPNLLDKSKDLKAWYDEIANKDAVKALLKDATKYFLRPAAKK